MEDDNFLDDEATGFLDPDLYSDPAFDWGCGDPYCHICGDGSWLDDDDEDLDDLVVKNYF